MRASLPTAILPLLILWLSSCSNFNDNLDNFPHELNLHVSPDQINTELPVIDIITDPDTFQNMYDNPDEEIEIEAHFNMYRNRQLVIENELIELEVKGNYSAQYPLKSLGVTFDKRFDNTTRTLINPAIILPHHQLDHIKAIRLRNSGNDFKQTMLKDLSYSQLAINAGLDLDLSYGEAALVYINGDFLGLLNLRTESNTNGMAGLYNADKDDITLAQMQNPAVDIKDGDPELIHAFVDAVETKNLSYLRDNIDLTNFIDFVVFQSYIANVDWPYTNVRFYTIHNGKFRFVLFDMDSANWVYLRRTPLEVIESDKENIISDLFFVLYEDENFKTQFWDRYHELMDSGLLSADNFEAIVIAHMERISPYMPAQIEKYHFPESMTEWFAEVDNLSSLFEKRKALVKKQLD